ncbi:MAG: hypothetical protein ACRCZK_07460 [Oscillospiraceae bacterium]
MFDIIKKNVSYLINDTDIDYNILDLSINLILDYSRNYLADDYIDKRLYNYLAEISLYKYKSFINDNNLTNYKAGDISLSFSDDEDIYIKLEKALAPFRKVRW